MANEYDPIVDQWYWHHDKGPRFYVVAVDDDERIVEVQHFSGEIEEYTFAQWRNLDVEPGEEPENWTGAMDIGERDDLGTEITDTSRSDWEEPAGDYHPDTERVPGGERRQRGRDDDYAEGHMEEEPLNGRDDEAAEPGEIDLAGVTRRPDGVYEETLDRTWYAEYTENRDSGLWRVDLYKHDVPEWQDIDFESLEEAVQAAREYYGNL